MRDQRSFQYSIASTVLIVLCGFFPLLAQAQECGQLRQRIYEITSTAGAQVPDSLHVVLDLAMVERECEPVMPVDREVWLLLAEVLALDGLERYDAAREKVDYFFANYFEDTNTTDFYRARFYLWRLHLSALNGADAAMIRDYTEAQGYAYALDVTHRASLLVDGAYAYHHIMQYETALILIGQAQDILGIPDTYDEQRTTARALLIGAESKLWLGEDLLQVKDNLARASDLYGALGDTSQVVIAETLLGLTLAAEGDTTSALETMGNAAEIASQSGSSRSQVYSLFRYGQLLRASGDYRAAEPILSRALGLTETHQEYYLDIAYELARLYDERRKLEQAVHFYRVVLTTPSSKSYAGTIKAQRKAHLAENRLLLIASERQRRRDQNTIGFLVLVLLGVGFVFLLRRRRRPPSVIEYGKGGFYIPYEMPTGLSLDELKARFETIPNITALAARRLAYSYALLFDRELIRAYITDEYLRPQIEEDRLHDNTKLFSAIAPIETAVDQQVFSGRPENSIRSHMSEAFKKHGWPWPSHPTEWKRYFMEYHMETLFGDD